MSEVQVYGRIDDRLVTELRKAISRGQAAHPIELHISSPGDSLSAGVTCYNLLRSSKREVHAYLDGDAFSAATLLVAAADYSEMPSNALMMIHEPWVEAVAPGTLEEVRKTLSYLQATRKQALAIYTEQTKLPARKLSKMMRDETYLDAKAALGMGFIKNVSGPSRDIQNRPIGEYMVRDESKLAQMLGARRVPRDVSDILKNLGVSK